MVRGEARRQGFALFLVLMAALLLVAAGALLSLHLVARLGLAADQERNLRLQVLLDSGYALAAAIVRDEPTFEGKEVLQLDGGLVRLEIEYAAIPGTIRGRRVFLEARFRGEVRRAQGLLALPVLGAPPRLYGLEPRRGGA